ncbi:hypothetical protein SAMN04487898_105148 [Pedobacter sp. ok626]|uniref:hypothetical protein n=1 Tax=Pedobacter sp. ok626 TaxID=1761882 RepID=UPI00088EF98C|nr:hypothetical protein [Pedobacter sp. ok626]SDJ95679.1 hypothetical protein SAMN04487898_105148 [Pedobacter sp. ok626]
MIKDIKYCSKCINFNGDDFTCAAFPNGIPNEILSGKIKHISKFPEQIGDDVFFDKIQFLKDGGIDTRDLEEWDDMIIED